MANSPLGVIKIPVDGAWDIENLRALSEKHTAFSIHSSQQTKTHRRIAGSHSEAVLVRRYRDASLWTTVIPDYSRRRFSQTEVISVFVARPHGIERSAYA